MKNKLDKILVELENPKKYVPVESVDEYFELPKNQRTTFGFWYKLPSALPWDIFKDNEKDGGWGEFYARIKKIYPIQYFIREVIWKNIDIYFYRLKRKWEDWYIYLFEPQHSELRATIPRNWRDLDTCIENFLYACIVSFVEEEDGLKNFKRLNDDKVKFDKLKGCKISKEERVEIKEHLEYQWGSLQIFKDYYADRYEDYQKINEIYSHATITRPKYLATLVEGKDYVDADGKKVDWQVIEELDEKANDLYLPEIVNLRKILWS